MLRVAVISDLHACDDKYGGDLDSSHYNFSSASRTELSCPFLGLQKHIKDKGTAADLLVCPGDLTHKAKPEPLGRAYEDLQTLRTSLNASSMFLTAGNHDLDSRHAHNQYDAKGMLQGLKPFFPYKDYNLSNEYWARNFMLHETDEYRILVINSCAYHGLNDDNERNYGRIADSTLTLISERLQDIDFTDDKRINIALCHHHPIHLPNQLIDPAQSIAGGIKLIELLGRPEHGRWLVIHGHNHVPYTCYGPGFGASPILFCAGSFAAKQAKNQFYMLDLDYAATGELVGQCEAWEWFYGKGWQPAQSSPGIAHRFGFGIRKDYQSISQDLITRIGSSYQDWASLCQATGYLSYVHPVDMEAALNLMTGTGGYRVLYDKHGSIEQIGKA